MVAAAVTLLAIPAARADFEISVIYGASTFSVVDDSLNDDNSPNIGNIGLSVPAGSGALAALNQFLAGQNAGIRFSNLAATSNSTTGSSVANLTVNGSIYRINTGSDTVQIVVSDTDYNFPTGGPSTQTTVDSSASQTYTAPGAGSTSTFQSFFNQDNSQFGRVTPTGILSFTPNSSASGTTSPTGVVVPGSGSIPLVLANTTVPYSLTNETVLTLAGTTSTNVGFSGATTVTSRAVPEPGSVALLLLGGSAIALRARRRRAVNA
jgi:hypothetical protein